MTWITGSVSSSETLTTTDDLYETHINQLRESNPPIAVVTHTENGQYYCDGTADEVQINAAIDYADDLGGGLVYLKPGSTFSIADSINLKDNVILCGAGRNTLIQAVSGFDGYMIRNDYQYDSAIATDNYNYGIRVRDLKLDGQNDVNTATDVFGICMQNHIDTIIERVEIVDTRGYGAIYLGRNVYAPGGNEDRSVVVDAHWRVLDCLIDNHVANGNNASVGIWVIGLDRVTKDIQIRGNTVRNCAYNSTTTAEGHGIMASKGTSDVVIDHNTIYHNGFIGINLGGLNAYTTSRCENIVVSNNTVYDLAGKAGTSCAGIYCGHNWGNLRIVGNTVSDINSFGIGVRAEATPTESACSIIGNTVTNCGKDTTFGLNENRAGILINIGCYTNVIGNTSADYQDTPTQSYGLTAYYGADYNTVVHNIFTDNVSGPHDIQGTHNIIGPNQED